MKITVCLSAIAFFVYCSVLVIVNGKPTADDVDDTEDITELKEELAQSVGRVSKLENLLAASVDIIAQLNSQLTTSSGGGSQPATRKYNTWRSCNEFSGSLANKQPDE